jgi:hypothetical protein
MTAAKLKSMPVGMQKAILAKMSPEDRAAMQEEMDKMSKTGLSADTTTATTETPTTEAAATGELATEAATEFTIPADLTTVADDALGELAAKIDARGAELASKGADLTDEELVEAESLAVVSDEFAVEKTRRGEVAADRAARAEASLARFKTAAPPAPAAEPTVDDGTGDAAAAAAELAAKKEPVPVDEPVVEDPEAAAGGKETETVTAAADAPKRPTSFRGASPAFVRDKARNVTAPVNEPEGLGMVATAFAKDPEGTEYMTVNDVASAMFKKRMSFGNIPKGTNEMLSIATGTKTFVEGAPSLGMDPNENLIALREIQETLVASGEFCTPQTQLYDFFRLAVPIRDVEDALPTAQAPRGGIRFIQANCTLNGAGAIGRYTYDPATPGGPTSEDPDFEKPCDRVTCPEIGEELVEAITQCTLFDNLQYRTFPELIEDFMADVAVQFALRKQRFYLDHIDAASTATTGIGSYGAVRSLFYDWMIAAVGYRKRQHMPRNAPLQLFAPDWALDVIKADMFNDGENGLDYLNVPDSAVLEGLRTRNLNVTWYYDDPTSFLGQNPLFNPQAGAAAPLNDFPAEVVSFMFAPGTFVKLDGGTLDVGLVRDHSLNKSNDFAMFMEEWLGFAMLGCESVRIDSLVCPSGSRAGYATELRACAAAVS